MFTAQGRDRLLSELIERARRDETVTAAALVGSAARGQLDAWSDIDLTLRLRAGSTVTDVADHWAGTLASLAPMADQLDVWSGPTLYRVFLLQNSLQVDLSFAPEDLFAPTGEAFALLFGAAGPPSQAREPDPYEVIGWGWLYALHARSAIPRGRSGRPSRWSRASAAR